MSRSFKNSENSTIEIYFFGFDNQYLTTYEPLFSLKPSEEKLNYTYSLGPILPAIKLTDLKNPDNVATYYYAIDSNGFIEPTDSAKLAYFSQKWNVRDHTELNDYATANNQQQEYVTSPRYPYPSNGIYGFNTSAGNYVEILATPEINTTPEPVKTPITLTQNITNCTISSSTPSDLESLYVGDDLTITLTATEGYEFKSDSLPTLTYKKSVDDGMGGFSYNNVTISTGVLNNDGTVTISAKAIEQDVITLNATATAKEEKKKVTVTIDNTHCVITTNPSDLNNLYVGDSLNVIVKAETNYVIDSSNPPTLTDGDTTLTFRSGNLNDYELTTTIKNETVTIKANAKVKSVGITSTVTNCTASWEPSGDSIPINTDITFTWKSNDGFQFNTPPYIEVYDGLGTTKIEATLTDSENASLKYTTGNITSISVRGTAEVKPDVPTTDYNFINIYSCTNDIIKALAAFRFSVADENSPVNVVDLAYYVTSLKRFYLPVPTSLSANIVMANIDSKITAKLVSSNTQTYNCGSVTIPLFNNNNNDYDNVEIFAYLPFIGKVSLEPDLVMNRELTLTYNYSLLSGDCIATISANDTILYSYTGNVSENIPYILNNVDWQMEGVSDFNGSILYGFTPVITVIRHNNYNDDSTALHNDNKYCKLSDLKGLCMVNDTYIHNEHINSDESSLIEQVLSTGVIF